MGAKKNPKKPSYSRRLSRKHACRSRRFKREQHSNVSGEFANNDENDFENDNSKVFHNEKIIEKGPIDGDQFNIDNFDETSNQSGGSESQNLVSACATCQALTNSEHNENIHNTADSAWKNNLPDVRNKFSGVQGYQDYEYISKFASAADKSHDFMCMASNSSLQRDLESSKSPSDELTHFQNDHTNFPMSIDDGHEESLTYNKGFVGDEFHEGGPTSGESHDDGFSRHSSEFYRDILSASDSDDSENDELSTTASNTKVIDNRKGHYYVDIVSAKDMPHLTNTNGDSASCSKGTIKHYKVILKDDESIDIEPVGDDSVDGICVENEMYNQKCTQNMISTKQMRNERWKQMKRLQKRSMRLRNRSCQDDDCSSDNPEENKGEDSQSKPSDSEYDSNNEEDLRITDRTIVSMGPFLDMFTESYEEHLVDIKTCTLNQWKLIGQKKCGYATRYKFECQNCHKEDRVMHESISPGVLDINTSAVAGSILVGIGHTQLTELTAYMGLYGMTPKMYIQKQQELCYEAFKKAALKSMRKAIAEEAKLAIENNEVTKDGIPCIKVSIDGSWMKRTYGSFWNSPAGTAAIIGWRTGKVLYFDVKNKYCLVCQRAKNETREPKKHKCYKNWDEGQPSTAMEQDIILQGFRESVPQHNIIYETVVMDNDSSTYKAIRDSNVYVKYGIVPRRILCSLHLRKNVKKNLLLAAKSTSTVQKGQRGIGAVRTLITDSVGKIMKRIEEVTQRRIDETRDWDEKVEQLRLDILNIPKHIFGDHTNCGERGDECTMKTEDNNDLQEIQSWGLYDQIEKTIQGLSYHSESLLHNITTNTNECLNSLIGHGTGGKRINWSLRNQYHTRVSSKVLHFNTGRAMSEFYRINKKVIPLACRDIEDKRLNKLEHEKVVQQAFGKSRYNKKKNYCKDSKSATFYGKRHEDIDKTEEEMQREKIELMERLRAKQSDRVKFQQDTVQKSGSQDWVSHRRLILTSSNFGEACTWNTSLSCANKVKKVLYSPISSEADHKMLLQGKDTARKIAQEKENLRISLCGLVIDSEHAFLGASPSALVGDDGILIIVIPKSRELSVDRAITDDKYVKNMFIQERKKKSGKEDNKKSNKKKKTNSSEEIDKTAMERKYDIRRGSHIYYQIQGALHVTRRNYCQLMIYTPFDYKMIKIDVDHKFWKDRMEHKLINFYEDCLLPEILDSRHVRGMPIRNPEYTSKKIEERDRKKAQEEAAMVPVKRKNESTDDSCKRHKPEVTSHQLPLPHDEECEFVDEYVDPSGLPVEHAAEFYDRRELDVTYITAEIMTRAQKLTDDTLDYLVRLLTYNRDQYDSQSVHYVSHPLHVTEKVTESSIQIMGGEFINHWRTAFYDFQTKKVHMYGSSPGSKLSDREMMYMKKRFSDDIAASDIIYEHMLTNQFHAIDLSERGICCGVYAAAFAVSLLFHEDPSEQNYLLDVRVMREHFRDIVVSRTMTPFPNYRHTAKVGLRFTSAGDGGASAAGDPCIAMSFETYIKNVFEASKD